MADVKVTVAKRTVNEDLAAEYAQPGTGICTAFEDGQEFVVDGLNQLPGFRCHKPAGAFYVFPNITETGQRSKDLQVAMMEKAGVAALAGTSFGEYGEGYIRLSYANSRENITRALERIEGLL